jgi:hypothetical protein
LYCRVHSIHDSPLSRHLDASAAGSFEDGYLSDKSVLTNASPQSSSGSSSTDENFPDMERMMNMEGEEDSEEEEEEAMDQEEVEPGTPTSLIPTIDQLFKRSYSLTELSPNSSESSNNSSSQQLTEELLRVTASPADQQLVILEDIHQILRDEANFELCV